MTLRNESMSDAWTDEGVMGDSHFSDRFRKKGGKGTPELEWEWPPCGAPKEAMIKECQWPLTVKNNSGPASRKVPIY